MKHLIVRVGRQKYALSIEEVVHIIDPVKLQIIPGVANYILGALNFHGELLMVIDLAQLLNVGGTQYDPMHSAMVICQLGERKFALVIDEVEAVEEFEGEVASINGDQVPLLQLDKVVDREKLNV